MSEDRRGDDEVRALRGLVEELREEAPPAIDWDRLEQRLLRQVALEQAARRRRPSHWGGLAAIAAAAAAVALFIVSPGSAPEDLATTDGDRWSIVDLDELPTGRTDDGSSSYAVGSLSPQSVVSSGDEPVRFSLPGVASWELAPHSRVVVESVSVPHVLTLQQGTVHAEVVPRHDSNQLIEAFVIEVGTTRVAVHGTAFSVERHRDHVNVTVNRGSVAVGPTGHRGVTSRHLLISPARASFSLEGGRLIESLPPRDGPRLARASTAEQEAQPETPGEAPPRDDGTVAETDAGEPLTAPRPAAQPDSTPDGSTETDMESNDAAEHAAPSDALMLDKGTAQALVSSCLRTASERATAPKLQVTITSMVTVTADADGKVGAVRFVPPLRPDLQQRCGSALFGRRLAKGATLSFPINVSAR
ncbi:MAG: hypothetical protein DRI90_24665 [Deltaproteobacteria bacterium]|nr:MAG: hypothetical protein DRI90_24665 [Deltaproteobacteria bacterium]